MRGVSEENGRGYVSVGYAARLDGDAVEPEEVPATVTLEGVTFVRQDATVVTMPAVPDALRSVRRSGADHADQLEREADALEARAYAMRLEAFHARNLHRLAGRHTMGDA